MNCRPILNSIEPVFVRLSGVKRTHSKFEVKKKFSLSLTEVELIVVMYKGSG